MSDSNRPGVIVNFLPDVDPAVGNPWQGRAWDPRAKRYRSKRWPTEAKARAWAEREHLRLSEGIATAGRVLTKDVMADYLKDLATAKSAPNYIREQKRVIESAIAAGVRDLGHPRAKKACQDWLDGLRCLHRFLEPIDPLEVEEPDEREGKPLSAKSRNEHLQTMSTLANYAIKHRMGLTHNPFDAIIRIPLPQTIKPVFTLEEIATLIRGPASYQKRPHLAGYHRFFQMMIYAGMREMEAAHIKWQWIDWDANRIRVHLDPQYRKKFDKEHVTKLQPEHKEALQAWADEICTRDPKVIIPRAQLRGYLFDEDFRKLTSAGHNHRFQAYLEECGVPLDDRSPHSCRHNYIAIMLATGEQLTLVQEFVAHEFNKKTTAKYAKSQSRFRDLVDAWPRGELPFLAHAASAQAGLPGPGRTDAATASRAPIQAPVSIR